MGGNDNRERCGGRVSGEVELFDRVGFTLTGGGFDGGGGETIRALVGVIIHQIVVAVARFCGFDGGLGRLEIRMLTGSDRGFLYRLLLVCSSSNYLLLPMPSSGPTGRVPRSCLQQ